MSEPNSVLRWAMCHFAGGDAFLCGLLVYAVCHVTLLIVRDGRCRRWLVICGRLGFIVAIAVPPPIAWPVMVGFAAFWLSGLIGWWRRKTATAMIPPSLPVSGTCDEPAELAQSAKDPLSSKELARGADARRTGGLTPPRSENTEAFLVHHTAPRATKNTRRELVYRLGLATCALVAIGMELPYRWIHRPSGAVKSLCVVGDSVTAGLNDNDDTWPQQLSRRVAVRILDASQPGATFKSARGQVELLNPLDGDLLLLEIGGNDLLEGLPLADFEADLERLLRACQKLGRSTVMMELPLPPLAWRYLGIQRRLAKRYEVELVPRPLFLQVLAASGSTVDGIHLSNLGQSRFADLVQGLVNFPAGLPEANFYRRIDAKK